MDFDTVADDLYAGEPASFVASRTAAARAAKSEGDAALARRIQALRKPTTAAFFVNRLARDGSPALAELSDLGDRLRAAHASLAGDQLRELAQRRAELVRSVLRDAPDLSDSVSREVEETLETVVADPAVARLVLAGRLTSVAHQDADQWLSLPASSSASAKKKPAAALVPAPSPSRAKKPAPAKENPRRKQADEKAAREKSEKDRATQERERAAREEWQRKASAATRERAEASRTLVRTERIAEQADARLSELRARLADAEDRAARAAADLTAARAAFDKADEAVQQFTHKSTSASRR
ncbi:hypothetical protein ACQPXB_39730 [Amycolatopsis sp. CA-161197]|uniref:hypothetical protein n=1 Tax=Amycolatopsis sp. CA-161197 TaxID=3239922 RepID=UPI003D91A13D